LRVGLKSEFGLVCQSDYSGFELQRTGETADIFRERAGPTGIFGISGSGRFAMAEVSPITGYSINSAFSNFGGQAGQSSTASGVGGVGAYHHHHRNQAEAPQTAAGRSRPPSSQTSDLLDVVGWKSVPEDQSAGLASNGAASPLPTGSQSSTLAAELAGSPAGRPYAPGQFLDVLA
jgi:hypothetical protein